MRKDGLSSDHVILNKHLRSTRDTHPPRGLGLHDLPVRGVGDSWKPGLLSSKVGGTAVKETDQQVQEHKVCGEREREGERGREREAAPSAPHARRIR